MRTLNIYKTISIIIVGLFFTISNLAFAQTDSKGVFGISVISISPNKVTTEDDFPKLYETLKADGYDLVIDDVDEEETGGGASVFFGYNFSDRWAVEFSGQVFDDLSTTHTAYNFADAAATTNPFVRKQTVTASASQLSARYKFNLRETSNWYLRLGAASWDAEIEIIDKENPTAEPETTTYKTSGTDPVLNLGYEIFLGELVSLRFETSSIIVNHREKDKDGATEDKESFRAGFEIGLAFNF